MYGLGLRLQELRLRAEFCTFLGVLVFFFFFLGGGVRV